MSPFNEKQDPKNGTMTLDIKDFAYAFNKSKDGNEESDLYFFATMMYVMHEFGHYGDKKSNNGKNLNPSNAECTALENGS